MASQSSFVLCLICFDSSSLFWCWFSKQPPLVLKKNTNLTQPHPVYWMWVCTGDVQGCSCSTAVLRNVAVQPPSDLVLIPLDPFNVVPHRLQRLLPGHHPSTRIRSQSEEILHLQDQQVEICYKKPAYKLSASSCSITKLKHFVPFLTIRGCKKCSNQQ